MSKNILFSNYCGLEHIDHRRKIYFNSKPSVPFTAGMAVTNRDVMLIIFTRCRSSEWTIGLIRTHKARDSIQQS